MSCLRRPRLSSKKAAAAALTAALAAFLSAAGCARPVTAPVPVADVETAYRLDSGDQLRVIVFGQEDLSGTYAVDDGGYISMPLLEPVPAAGRTTRELEDDLVAVLGETLLRNPSVSVEVQTFRPFFILGEVNAAGQYPYVNGMTVQTAVAIAGGYTYRARRNSARVTRQVEGRLVESAVPPTAPVRPGDTVFVAERFF